jgi:hypothetical protein
MHRNNTARTSKNIQACQYPNQVLKTMGEVSSSAADLRQMTHVPRLYARSKRFSIDDLHRFGE